MAGVDIEPGKRTADKRSAAPAAAAAAALELRNIEPAASVD